MTTSNDNKLLKHFGHKSPAFIKLRSPVEEWELVFKLLKFVEEVSLTRAVKKKTNLVVLEKLV